MMSHPGFTRYNSAVAAGLVVIFASLLAPMPVLAADPSVELFQQKLNAQLQLLKPVGYTVRTVLFQDVRPGKQDGAYFPFQVTAAIHDYGSGYPRNAFYGATCVGKMDKVRFDMRADAFGDWIVEGAMTPTDHQCKDNPSEGVSSMPLAGLTGRQAQPASASAPAAKPAATGTAGLYLGEYACYGADNQMIAGMDFRMMPAGKYTDGDGKRGGTYVYKAAKSAVSFRGGFLDGQHATHVRTTGLQLSENVSCTPSR
jgi:hypothetical protein